MDVLIDRMTAPMPTESMIPTAPLLPLRDLEAQITELAGQLNAAQHRWLRLIAEFDRRGGWHDGSLRSCAHWLNFKCGLDLGAAREKVRVAHALATLPQISAAMARGALSYSKVRALTRVACAATEEFLLMIALHGTAQHVENLVRHYRRAQDAEALSREAHQQSTRSVRYWYDVDGSLVVKARLPALAGATLVKALDLAMSCAEQDGGTECEADSFEARRADALARVADSFLHRKRSCAGTAERFQVMVHVDAQTLAGRLAGRCHVEDGPALPVETVRRLACDGSLVQIIESARGEPLDVGRRTRSIPPALRRALNSRDPGCCFPGCTHRRYLDAHHIEHWAEGGSTKLSNLVTLCRTHHRLVHEGGIVVERHPEGTFRFLHPDGRAYDGVVPANSAYHWSELGADHAEQGLHIDPDTAVTRWRGERMDYDFALTCLFDQTERARDVSAETLGGIARHRGVHA